jgi:Niemann-Pick C1 protein
MVKYSNASANGNAIPAFYNGPAFAQPSPMPFCSEIFPNGTDICCTIEQLNALQISTGQQAAGLLSRCPSCYRNFVQFWCLFTCSPDQSMFLTLNEVNAQGVATRVTTNVNPGFANGTFESCDQVRLVDGSSVMLIFGGATNYETFFEALGNTSRDTRQLQIDFSYKFVRNSFGRRAISFSNIFCVLQ